MLIAETELKRFLIGQGHDGNTVPKTINNYTIQSVGESLSDIRKVECNA